METPLDVLSRAATLIHDQLKSAKNDDSNQVRRELIGYDDADDDANDADDDHWNSASAASAASSKELPTRAKKERRRHERHHELVSASAASRNSKPHHHLPHHRIKNASAASAPEEPVDRPLDMSTNRRPSAHRSGRSPPPYPVLPVLPAYPSGNSGYPMYPSPPDYIARPSVITCASSLRSSPAPSCPSPCSSTGSVSSSRIGAGSPLPPLPPLHHRPADTGRIPQRHISSGMSDPVIDEHFRRSLGERYTHLFASSTSSSSASSASLVAADSSTTSGGGHTNPSSRDDKLPSTVNVTGLSVDDHFAKALGETWLKLQNENKDKEISGADSQPGSPMTTQRPGLVLT